MFSGEYYGVFKKTYFEKHLQTAAFEYVLGAIKRHQWHEMG